MSMVGCSHFSSQESYYAAHTLGLNFTMKSWGESLALMRVIMHGPNLKWTQLLWVIWWYHLWAACPCLSWSTVAFSRSISLGLGSEGFIVSTFTQHEFCLARVKIWIPLHPFVQFKFSLYGHTRTYTHVLQCKAHSGSPQLFILFLGGRGEGGGL